MCTAAGFARDDLFSCLFVAEGAEVGFCGCPGEPQILRLRASRCAQDDTSEGSVFTVLCR